MLELRSGRRPEEGFRFGCRLELDADGDWVLLPPADVTIFSTPGEGRL